MGTTLMLPPIDLATCNDRELDARIAMLFRPRGWADDANLVWVAAPDRDGYPHWEARPFSTDIATCFNLLDFRWPAASITLELRADAEYRPATAWSATIHLVASRPILAAGPTRNRAFANAICAGSQRFASILPLGDADKYGHAVPPGWSSCVLCLGDLHEDLPTFCPGRQLTATEFAGVASGLLDYVCDDQGVGYWVSQTPPQPPDGG